MRLSGIWNRLIVSTIAAAFLAAVTAAVVSAQWPTTCVELNDIVEGHLGNTGNVGIYQATFGDQAEAACQNDHRTDVQQVFAWAVSTTGAPTAGRQPDIFISASAFQAEFERNEAAAKVKYSGKLIHVTGVIDEIDEDAFEGDWYVNLEAGRYSFRDLECELLYEHLPWLQQITSGQSVSLIGYFARYSSGIKMKDCRPAV